MTTPRSPKEAEPDAAADVADSEMPEDSPTTPPSAEAEPDAASDAAEVDPSEAPAVDAGDEQAPAVEAGDEQAPAVEAGDEQVPPEEPPTTRPPAGPAPAWAWVVLGLMALLLAMGVTTLAVASNADPSTPEAVEDAKTLVAEMEKLNSSLATTNELMSNAIANAEQLSAKAQAKLADLSSQLADVDGGVGQVRSLLGDQLSKPTRSELGSDQERLQSLKGTLAERSGRLTEQELGRVSRDVAAIGNEVGVATRRGSSRASTIEGRIDELERTQRETDGSTAEIAGIRAETDGFRAQIAELRAAADELRQSLQARRRRARSLAGQLRELRRAQALLQRRLDSLGPRR